MLPIPKERQDYYLAHENEHAIEAEKLGIEFNYVLSFFQATDGKGGYHVQPAVSVIYSDTMSFEEYQDALRKIAGAPQELSDGDQKQLENLE